jgi:small subunit ribosomal protein S16
MSTRIRLRRVGRKKLPLYRIVVADQEAPRDGRFIEIIGKYHPLSDPSLIEIDEERALHWLRVGAQPSSQVLNLLRKTGIWDAFEKERPSVLKQRHFKAPERGDKTDRPKLSKKAQTKATESAKAASAPVPAPAEEPAQAPAEEPAEA